MSNSIQHDSLFRSLAKAIVLAAVIVAFLWLLQKVATILLVSLLAIVFVVVINAPVSWLEKLLTIKEADDTAFIPKLSIAFGFILSVCSLGVMIFFIHHIASSIEVEHVIKSSFNDLAVAIDNFMVDAQVHEERVDDILMELTAKGYKKNILAATTSGYTIN